MESELAQLAASGATTLTGLMVSDAWNQVRDRISRFFAHADANIGGINGNAIGEGDADGSSNANADIQAVRLRAAEEEAAAAEARRLDHTRTELLDARSKRDTELEEELSNVWLLRLRQILRADPAASAELRALLREVDPDASAATAGLIVHNSITGDVNGSVIQAGRISGGVTTNGAPATATRPGPRSWD